MVCRSSAVLSSLFISSFFISFSHYLTFSSFFGVFISLLLSLSFFYFRSLSVCSRFLFSIYLSIYLSLYLSLSLRSLSRSLPLPLRPSHLSIHPLTCLFYLPILSIYLPANQPTYMPIYPSIYLPIYLSLIASLLPAIILEDLFSSITSRGERRKKIVGGEAKTTIHSRLCHCEAQRIRNGIPISLWVGMGDRWVGLGDRWVGGSGWVIG